MQELPNDQIVYLICQGGGRSGKAADLSRAASFDVRSFAGGTTGWVEAGGEVTTGSSQGWHAAGRRRRQDGGEPAPTSWTCTWSG